MGSEEFGIAIVIVTGRELAFAVVGGVAPAGHDIARLFIDDVYFAQIARGEGHLIGIGVVRHAVEMRPVGAGRDRAALGRQKDVDINLSGPCPGDPTRAIPKRFRPDG